MCVLNVIILAGGKSRRMGTDKARLVDGQQNNRDLLQRAFAHALRVIAGVDESQQGVVLVSGNYPEYLSLADNFPECGPLSGIEAGLSYLLQAHDLASGRQWLLVLPVDMPNLEHPVLQSLLQGASEDKTPGGAQAFFLSGSNLPLLLQLAPEVLALVRENLSQRDPANFSLRQFLQKLRTVEVAPSENTALCNLNTPADYQQWCAAAKGVI